MDVVAGVVATVQVRVISVDTVAGTAVIRVIDNNGVPLSPNATLPIGVITPTQFPTALGDVLEEVAPTKRTAVVRWVSDNGQAWSESPSGVPARDTLGWQKIGNFPLP